MKDDVFARTYGFQYDSLSKPADCNPPNHPEPLYYYTTVETFQKIAETGSIFASHIKRMNDWKEFDVGADRVLTEMKKSIEKRRKEIYQQSKPQDTMSQKKKQQANDLLRYYRTTFIESAIHSCGRCHRYVENDELQMYRFSEDGVYGMDYAFPELYSISFTSQKDLLSQWRIYARESGVAIEFDFSGRGKRLTFLQGTLKNGKDSKDFPSPCTFPQPVSYQIKSDPLQLNDALDVKKLFSGVPYYKDTGFHQESESRLIFRPYKKMENDKIICSKLSYRTANHLLVPYLVIYCAQTGDWKKLGWPIVSLTVGPGHNQDAVFEGLVHFVEYCNLKICPFTDEELMQARIRYYREFWDGYNMLEHKFPSEELDKWAELAESKIRCESITSALEQERLLYAQGQQKICSNKQKAEYKSFFQGFCRHSYLASNGVIIQKSKIPYIFN